MPGDDPGARMAQLFVELLSGDGLPYLVFGGAYHSLRQLTFPSARSVAALCRKLLEMDICRLATTHLQAIDSAGKWMVSLTLMRWPRCVPSN